MSAPGISAVWSAVICCCCICCHWILAFSLGWNFLVAPFRFTKPYPRFFLITNDTTFFGGGLDGGGIAIDSLGYFTTNPCEVGEVFTEDPDDLAPPWGFFLPELGLLTVVGCFGVDGNLIGDKSFFPLPSLLIPDLTTRSDFISFTFWEELAGAETSVATFCWFSVLKLTY